MSPKVQVCRSHSERDDFTFPAHRPAALRGRSGRHVFPARLAKDLRRAAQARACILLALDCPTRRAVLASALERYGLEVHPVADGPEALEWLADRLTGDLRPDRPDLIVADLRLAGYKGIDLLAGLRSANWCVPFIGIIAPGDERLARAARAMGTTLVFTWPFEMDDFAMAVDFLLDVGVRRKAANRQTMRRETA